MPIPTTQQGLTSPLSPNSMQSMAASQHQQHTDLAILTQHPKKSSLKAPSNHGFSTGFKWNPNIGPPDDELDSVPM